MRETKQDRINKLHKQCTAVIATIDALILEIDQADKVAALATRTELRTYRGQTWDFREKLVTK